MEMERMFVCGKETKMTIDEMIRQKRILGFTNERLSELSDVPLGTVQKIFAGITKNPRWKTRKALEQVLLREMEKTQEERTIIQNQLCQSELATRIGKNAYGETRRAESVLHERAAYFGGDPRQGEYTLDDYLGLPDDYRVELINGYLYDMAGPSKAHQVILLQLALQFQESMDEHPACELFLAPQDVVLKPDQKTVVQPDLFIYCNAADRDKNRHHGVPDFVLEIVSPSSREMDYYVKLHQYWEAGVREYWIVDPQKKKVQVHDFDHHTGTEIYDFSNEVPVGISEGTCRIDFAKILAKAEKYL